MAKSGIRFTYFSVFNERQTRAFAGRIGLETDWNCIISLRAGDAPPTMLEDCDLKARLPRGTAAIRDHLRDVDNVPLLVSLFANAQPDTTEEMVRILQEHGEVVCCVGSSLNWANAGPFAAADASIAIDPSVSVQKHSISVFCMRPPPHFFFY